MSPDVTVIVPVWNAVTYLDAALQSVWKQGLNSLQLIVIDDGSTDGTTNLIASYGTDIVAIHQSNQGPAAARNSGLRVADGEFVAFIDADDLWSDGRLNQQIRYLQSNPETDIVQGRIQYIRASTEQLQPYADPFFALSLASGLFRKRAFQAVGLLDESLRYCEDVDWFVRARSKQLRVGQIEAVTLYYRQHAHNATRHQDRVRKSTLRVLMKHKHQQTSTP